VLTSTPFPIWGVQHSVGFDRRRLHRLLQRMPWAGKVAVHIYRTWQPWVTVGAVGAVFNSSGKLLVVEHVFHPKFPWGLPGGWMARGETPDETVRREVHEETNLQVEIVKPLVVARTSYLSGHLDMAYLCRLAAGASEDAIRLSTELMAYQWADPNDLPPMVAFHCLVVQQALAERLQTNRP